MGKEILIVDDDRSELEKLSAVVRTSGFDPVTVETGEEAIKKMSDHDYLMMLLDINLPGISGFEVIRCIRKIGSDIPVIVISGRIEDDDVLYALDLGADLYLTKPVNPVTLEGRMKAILRRNQVSRVDSDINCGPFLYNTTTLRLYKNDKEIALTHKENSIMKLFLDNVNHVFSKEKLYEMVWGNAVVDDNTIMVYISRLRQKIEDDPASPRYIQNVRGIGYRFVI